MDADFVPGTTFDVHIPLQLFKRLERIAFKQGVTISWILRYILENPFDYELPRGLRRPKKFTEKMHRFPICMYGQDKRMWKMKAAGLECELGALIRHLLGLYNKDLEEMWHSGGTVRHSEEIEILVEESPIRHIGYGYHYHMLIPEKRFYVNENINRMSNRRKMLFGIYKRWFSTSKIRQMLKTGAYI